MFFVTPYLILILLIRFLITFIFSKEEQKIKQKIALYIFWFLLLFFNIIIADDISTLLIHLNIYLNGTFVLDSIEYDVICVVHTIASIVIILSLVMPFRLYLDLKVHSDEKKERYLIYGLVVVVIIFLCFIGKTGNTAILISVFSFCYIFSIFLAIISGIVRDFGKKAINFLRKKEK